MKPLFFNRSLLTVTLALCGLFAYSFSGAQNWTAPTSTPPTGNVPAPINVGTEDQAKRGNFGANILSTATTTGAVWSNQYCDAWGQNCQVLGGGSTSTPTQLGIGQRWYNLAAERAQNALFQNNTSQAIVVSIGMNPTSRAEVSSDGINWVTVASTQVAAGGPNTDVGEYYVHQSAIFVVPVGGYYRFTGTPVRPQICTWYHHEDGCRSYGPGPALPPFTHWSELRESPVSVTRRNFTQVDVNQAIWTLTGLTADRVANRGPERDAVCAILFPGSQVFSFTDARFTSPSDNTILWLNGGVWQRVGARSYNSQINTISCFVENV